LLVHCCVLLVGGVPNSAAGWFGTVRKVLLPVYAQQVVLLAFNQLYGRLAVFWWLCAVIGCSCGVLLAVV
jgi:hypothetical protein